MKRTKQVILAILITILMNACAQAAAVVVVSTDPNAPGPLAQDNYILSLFRLHPDAGLDPNDPNQLPILGPVTGDPNAWDVPCGPWRRGGKWKGPEGMPVAVTLLASDLECEVSTGADGTWAATFPFVTQGWHYLRVRATDEPPAGSDRPAARDVEIWFRGIPGPNWQPVVE